ncbi:MAG TPA: Dabb family protein [Leifsonia sp.]|nr:Dabb family protein [Leifsonia sp.]
MTIRHVVSWKLATTDASERAEQADAIRRGLEGLPAFIPELLALEVGVNALSPEANYDVVLISDFEDEDAIKRYLVHPEHEKVASYIKSVVDERSAVDFVV